MTDIRITVHPIVGHVRWRILPGSPNIELLDDWADKNLIRVHIAVLKGIPTYGGRFSGDVLFYKYAVPQLLAAWHSVAQHGLMDRVLTWDGSFVPRLVRGSYSTPSNHAFGIAFDINAKWNGLGAKPPLAGEKGSVRELVPIFEKYGFTWGGHYKCRPDGMHFEVKRLLSDTDVRKWVPKD